MNGRYVNKNGVVLDVIVDNMGQATYKFVGGESRCVKLDSLVSMLRLNGYTKVSE